MLSHLQNILHPERYHGHGRRPPFFEGWYFKMVDREGNNKIAIIPGIFLNDDPAMHHAFIQILDGVAGVASYYRFPADDFVAARDRFDVRIGANHFTSTSLSVYLEGLELEVSGSLTFHSLSPWPVHWRSPGIMGWYAWVPGMECYHGVVSLDHEIQGTLTFKNKAIDFGQARGYIEKDWGRSFPAAWVWMQTNHFLDPGTSLTASIAIIPWLKRPFPGFIIGLWHGQRLYRFATYTGARTEVLQLRDDWVQWTVRDRHFRLRMQGTKPEGGLLLGPTRQAMHTRVDETLNASVAVELTTLDGTLIFSGQGQHAGMEIQGDLDRLLALQQAQLTS